MLTTVPFFQLGRLTHYAFDALLVSAFLAGVKRSTGLTYVQPFPSHFLMSTLLLLLSPPNNSVSNPFFYPNLENFSRLESRLINTALKSTGSPSLKFEKLSDSPELKNWVDRYLDVGEWVMDQSVAVMGSSSWFERKK